MILKDTKTNQNYTVPPYTPLLLRGFLIISTSGTPAHIYSEDMFCNLAPDVVNSFEVFVRSIRRLIDPLFNLFNSFEETPIFVFHVGEMLFHETAPIFFNHIGYRHIKNRIFFLRNCRRFATMVINVFTEPNHAYLVCQVSCVEIKIVGVHIL